VTLNILFIGLNYDHFNYRTKRRSPPLFSYPCNYMDGGNGGFRRNKNLGKREKFNTEHPRVMMARAKGPPPQVGETILNKYSCGLFYFPLLPQ
jgi:hypothetical protein